MNHFIQITLIVLSAFAGLMIIAFAIHTLRLKAKHTEAAREDLVQNDHGILVTHGMVRAEPGKAGVKSDKKLSRYYLETTRV